MDDEVDQEWLKTPEGRTWLESDDGMEWFRTTEGQWWSRSDDAHAWYEELADRGWSDYFADAPPVPPERWIRPQDAPQVGSLVQWLVDSVTLGGTKSEKGEIATVTEVTLMPMGGVRLTLRTPDGRHWVAMFKDEYQLVDG